MKKLDCSQIIAAGKRIPDGKADEIILEEVKRDEIYNDLRLKTNELQEIKSSLAFRTAFKMAKFGRKMGLGLALSQIRKIKNRKTVGIKSVGNISNNILSLPEFEFFSYKEKREKSYSIILEEVQVPCVTKMVSIILPVYNGGKLLTKSIDSVLRQTYKNFEFIIVNDGSTDDTADIVDGYAKKDSRIRVIHKKNEKLPATLSRGFKEARGEFFTWTSADNIMENEFVEKLVSEMEHHPDTGMVFANMRLIDENDDPITTNRWYYNPEKPEELLFPHSILELNTFANNFIGAAFMYKASVAHAIGDYSLYKYCTEDYDYWMRINDLFQLRHIDFNEPIYNYRFHSGSLTANDKKLKISENRYRLMLLDSFRRDYFLKPLVWLFSGTYKDIPIYHSLKKSIQSEEHKIIELEDSTKYQDSKYEQIIHLHFQSDTDTTDLPVVNFNCFNVFIGKKPEQWKKYNWDCYISLEETSEKYFLEDHKGWFSFITGYAMFGFLDAKAKGKFTYEMEAIIETPPLYTKEMSIILCYNKKYNNLEYQLASLGEQKDISRNNYEIIIVSGEDTNDDIQKIIAEVVEQYGAINIRTIFSPIENIVDYYNTALWAAEGKLCAFIDTRCICDSDYIKRVIYANYLYPDASAISGKIMGGDSNKRINAVGTIIFKTEEARLTGGFSRLDVVEESFDWIGWENSILKKLNMHGKCIKAIPSLNVYPISIQSMTNSEKREAEMECSRYQMSIQQLYPYDFWPDEIKTKIVQCQKYEPNNNEVLKILLEQVQRDWNIRTNANNIRNKYSNHLIYCGNKIEYHKEQDRICAVYPLISIIVPVYKVEKYLKRCVDSILNQTLKNIEIILVDDGSPDDCPQLCDQYALIDKRVRVIHQENGGLSKARNSGIDVAIGEYIMFIDSDDWIDDDMCDVLYRLAIQEDADIVECSYREIYDNCVDESTKNTGKIIIEDSKYALKSQLEWLSFNSIAWDKLYHRSIFADGKRYPLGRYHEDEFFTHQAFFAAKRLAYIDISKYNYWRAREDSITGNISEKILDSCYALRERVDFIERNYLFELDQEVKNTYCWILFDRLYKCHKAHITGEKLNQLLLDIKKDKNNVLSWHISEDYKREYRLLEKSYRLFAQSRDNRYEK